MLKTAVESSSVQTISYTIYSDYLQRKVLYDIYLPSLNHLSAHPSLLLINDGQDLQKMDFQVILNVLMEQKAINNVICIGIHCGAERKREYGTAFSCDYEKRGDKAGLYTKFIFDELMPEIRKNVKIASFKEKGFAGFSLGGLSALDIVWNHASEFSKVGVFSGALWWRRKSYEDGYSDEHDRLMHIQVKSGQLPKWLQFYFQTGTLDETADRNNNGIIDAIEDVTDLIKILKQKGCAENNIRYEELKDGKHDVATWATALPEFLKWGWGK